MHIGYTYQYYSICSHQSHKQPYSMSTTLNIGGGCSIAARTAADMKFPAPLTFTSTDTARALQGRARLQDRPGRTVIMRPGVTTTHIHPKVSRPDVEGRLRTRSILPGRQISRTSARPAGRRCPGRSSDVHSRGTIQCRGSAR
jgi:hypothetical protein